MNQFKQLIESEPFCKIYGDDTAYRITPSGIERGHVEYDKRNGTSRWNSDKTISAKPFLPTAILDNQDEAVQKVEVSLWERNRWKQTVVNREVLCNSSKVSQLANMGFPVGSDNAKDVARYFNSILAEYDEMIPRHASRSVMDGQNWTVSAYSCRILTLCRSTERTRTNTCTTAYPRSEPLRNGRNS